MNFKKHIIVLIILMFYPVICFSQIDSEVDSSRENYNQAIQFYIINQVIAAYKHHLSETSAIRFTINASGLFKDEDVGKIEYRERTTDTIAYYHDREFTNSDQFFEIKIQYLYHIRIHKIIQLFFGGGPFVNYSFIQDEDWYKSYNSNSEEISTRYSKRIKNIWNVGISIVIGLECVVYDNISLFAEYEANISRGWQTENYFSTSQTYYSDDYTIDNWTYELKGLRIGLSIYF